MELAPTVVESISRSLSETLLELVVSPVLVEYGKRRKNRPMSGRKRETESDCDEDSDEEPGVGGDGGEPDTVR